MHAPLARPLRSLAARSLLVCGLLLAALSVRAQAPVPAAASLPPDAAIKRILVDRVGPADQGFALVVGVIDGGGRRVVAHGSLAQGDPRPLDGDTVFEIGSVTKVFTSLILMDLARKSEVAVTDPVAKHLPAGTSVPERGGQRITLRHLAVQNSGLPRMPGNFAPADPANPYADYTPERLYAFLAGYRLPREIGAQFEYSNLGVGLLGHALSLRAGQGYEALVRERVLRPLGMASTGLALTPAMQARLATGHGPALAPTANWDLADVLAGAGGLRSTAHDMLAFLAAFLGYEDTPLAGAMAAQLAIREPAGGNMKIAYGWFIAEKNGKTIVWHNGGTGGYRSWAGFDPVARTGVVVLANFTAPAGPDDIGRHLLDASFPLAQAAAPRRRTEATVAPAGLERYLGVYLLAPQVALTITRDGDQLYTQLSGQPKLPIYPEGDGKFFLKVVDAQLTFAGDTEGKAAQVTLHQNGRDQIARRADAAHAAQLQATQTALDKRIQAQLPAPGSESTLRRHIAELQAGEPAYDLMTPAYAAVTRRQLTQTQAALARFGALKSIAFKGVGPAGADLYEVRFEHATTEWRLSLDPEQRIAGLNFRPL